MKITQISAVVFDCALHVFAVDENGILWHHTQAANKNGNNGWVKFPEIPETDALVHKKLSKSGLTVN